MKFKIMYYFFQFISLKAETLSQFKINLSYFSVIGASNYIHFITRVLTN